MNTTSIAAGRPEKPTVRSRWNRCADRLDSWIGHTVIGVVSRCAIAAIFFLSGRTKVDGVLSVNETAYTLFREDYKVPLLPPELAAHLAAYAEHLFPLLLILGLFTRVSALALLAMTAVIQIFVYPDAWPTHLSWAAPMLYLIGRGGGRLSLDHALGIR